MVTISNFLRGFSIQCFRCSAGDGGSGGGGDGGEDDGAVRGEEGLALKRVGGFL